MHPSPSRLAGACCAAALAGACGELADGGYRGRPVVSVHGTLTEGVPIPGSGSASLALLWAPADALEVHLDPSAAGSRVGYHETCASSIAATEPLCDGRPAAGEESCRWRDDALPLLIQAVEHVPHLGRAFDIPIYDPPPSAAVYDLSRQGGTGVFALASVVAFVDDGDGRLRHGTPEAPPEATLATSENREHVPAPGVPRRSYRIAFLDGLIDPDRIDPASAEVLLFLPQGFSLWLTETYLDAAGRPVATGSRARPPESETINLVTSANLAAGCREGIVERAFLAGIPAGAEPAWCSDDWHRARWSRTTTDSACRSREERYEGDYSCAAEPATWECPGVSAQATMGTP